MIKFSIIYIFVHNRSFLDDDDDDGDTCIVLISILLFSSAFKIQKILWLQKVYMQFFWGNFQSITSIRTHVFWIFISVKVQPSVIFRVPSVGENWRKWHHFLKNTTLVKIITSSTGVHIKKNTHIFNTCNFLHYLLL